MVIATLFLILMLLLHLVLVMRLVCMSLQILFGGQVENAKSLSEIKANNHENMEIISILSKL